MTAAAGTTGTQPLRLYVGGVAVVAAGLVLLAASQAAAGAAQEWPRVAVAFALAIACRWIFVTVRFGSQRLMADWSEAAVVVTLVLVAGPWVVLASVAGMVIVDLARRRPPLKMLMNVSATAIAVSAASGLFRLLGGTADNHVELGTLPLLAAAAICGWLVSNVLIGVAIGMAQQISPLRVLTEGRPISMVAMIGNIAVAVGVIEIGQLQPWGLLAVPPVLWLVHQGHVGRTRTRQERRTWHQLAAATRALNQLDQDQVIDAAITGAAEMFAADVVEIDSAYAPPQWRLTRGDRRGSRWRGAPGALVRSEPLVVPSTLAHDGEVVGELRLCFKNQVDLGERERLALSTYADAVAAALANASAHQRIRELADRTRYEASHDTLTGLINRDRLLDLIDLRRTHPVNDSPDAAFALLLFDLSHFKEVNDTLGHTAGDALLVRVAERMADGLALGEQLGRLDSDKFALLMAPELDSEAAARAAKERAGALQSALAEPIVVEGVTLTVEVRVGLAITEVADGCPHAELLRRADIAMYEAKSSGRSLVMYSPERDGGRLDRLSLAAELRYALSQDDQLFLELQPLVDLSTGVPLGAEALVRWRHPRRGLLGPAEFIPVIERSELIHPFTQWVLDEALSIICNWDTGDLDVPVAVNLSARSLLDRRLPEDIDRMLRKYRLPASALVLEITETVIMSELEVVEEVLDGLRRIGVQIAVDDFGTGYSSLTFLARVRVDEVKIDQSFVKAMHHSVEAYAIVSSTITLATSLGLRVIAEGIETALQREELAGLGCTGGQGYGLYPPMSADAVTALVEEAADGGSSSLASNH
ncbi:putative bifunctional diguanylate cyclase/phosphodiesterase [Fodinicola acaciae]|uniref:putative bifunctional diguanylate cyclase/phosphodiesterase n=1 Tax=Fodinicola acaciae TaxID=2681555 RepID=UPI0013D2402C|nr:bifunctional diguanylate cyclase/phosphodiesterase [Fodinicola acaciae]